jgi:DNA-binding NarL/FixJ family response regulator
MDIHMPGLNGIEATRRIRGLDGPAPRVVALSAYSDERAVQEMIRAGASAYVLKDAAFEELSTAVRTVAADKMYLSPSVARIVVDDYARRGREPLGATAFNTLTSREREILQLLAEGLATKQAAAHLNVSVKTVETHRRNIMEKLDMHSVAELTKYAIRQGLTTIEA